jgi:hypothetical protein
LEEIINDLLYFASTTNPYGMICPVVVKKDGIEIRRVGNTVHIDGKGKAKDFDKWYDAVYADQDIIEYFQPISVIKRKLLESGIKTDRDLVKLLNLSDEQKKLVYLWVDLQREYERRSQTNYFQTLINSYTSFIEKRIKQTKTEIEKWKEYNPTLFNVIVSKGGKVRGFNEVLNFIRQHK